MSLGVAILCGIIYWLAEANYSGSVVKTKI